MNPKSLKKAIITWLPEAAVIVLVIIALRKGNPYGYYAFLRWMVCPAMVWIAWKAYNSSFGILMVITAGLFAVLFNPLLRVMLDREKWEILNIGLIAVAIWSAVVSLKFSGQQA